MLWTTLRCARHLKIRDVPENGNKGNNETGTKRQKVVSRDAVGSATLARHLKMDFLRKFLIMPRYMPQKSILVGDSLCMLALKMSKLLFFQGIICSSN